MVDAIIIRPAVPKDARAIVDLAVAEFAHERKVFFVMSCDGAATWVAAQIASPAPLRERTYVVAERNGDIVGIADLVHTGDGVHLAYIASSRSCQRRGLASRLLRTATLLSMQEPRGSITLDVFDDNVAALHWYSRIGFVKQSEGYWWTGQNTATPDTPMHIPINGLPFANTIHDKFGFSQIELSVGTRRVRVGRIGREWYRIDNADALQQSEIASALRLLAPERRLLVTTAVALQPAEGFRQIARFVRMQMAVPAMLDALARPYDDQLRLGK